MTPDDEWAGVQYVQRGRLLLWREHRLAIQFAEMRYLVHRRRQLVKPVVIDGYTWWHVSSKGNGEGHS